MSEITKIEIPAKALQIQCIKCNSFDQMYAEEKEQKGIPINKYDLIPIIRIGCKCRDGDLQHKKDFFSERSAISYWGYLNSQEARRYGVFDSDLDRLKKCFDTIGIKYKELDYGESTVIQLYNNSGAGDFCSANYLKDRFDFDTNGKLTSHSGS